MLHFLYCCSEQVLFCDILKIDLPRPTLQKSENQKSLFLCWNILLILLVLNENSMKLAILSTNTENMNLYRFSTRTLNVLFLTLIFGSLFAQEGQSDKDYIPRFGEPGKDARWEPTPQIVVEKMLDLAKVTSKDFVIDLGSGDGRLVIAAAKRDARARGIEYNPNMVVLSRRNAANEGLSDRAEFIQGDLFEADISQATVITMYLLTRNILRLRPSLLELKPGTRIVSNSHTMDDWIPDAAITDIEDGDSFWNVYFWIVPAKVEGTWKIHKGELKLSQKFQMISGTLKTGRNTITITGGSLYGNVITFSANDEKYSGRVNGNSIEGIVTSVQETRKWNAALRGN